MIKKLAFTFACAFALVTIAPVPATGNLSAAPAVAVRVAVAPATMTMPAAADVSVVNAGITQLTPQAMSEVQGAGFWSWLKNTVKKLAKWIWNNREAIWTLIQTVTSTTTTTGSNGMVAGDDRTDHISATEDVDENYDENGGLVSSSYSSSESVDYTEYSPSGN